jgi:hypothetical protein
MTKACESFRSHGQHDGFSYGRFSSPPSSLQLEVSLGKPFPILISIQYFHLCIHSFSIIIIVYLLFSLIWTSHHIILVRWTFYTTYLWPPSSCPFFSTHAPHCQRIHSPLPHSRRLVVSGWDSNDNQITRTYYLNPK